jgi:hypothetical protein
MQLTLEGKPADEIYRLIKRVDEIARKNPAYFSERLAEVETEYRLTPNKLIRPSLTDTLICCANLQKALGLFTENMVAALMAYPVKV